MNDQQVMHALGIDDAYEVDRTLASGPGGVTELVTLDGSTPLIRKRIPTKLARRGVWGTLSECDCARLPRVAATYEMPDEFLAVIVVNASDGQLRTRRGFLLPNRSVVSDFASDGGYVDSDPSSDCSRGIPPANTFLDYLPFFFG